MKVKTNLRAGSGGTNSGGVNSGGVNGGHGADNATETQVVYVAPVTTTRCVGY